MNRMNIFHRAGLALVGLAVIATTGGVALARTSGPAGSTGPTVVVSYYHDGTLLGSNAGGLNGFDLTWKPTKCSGKWLARPVIVLSEAQGAINSAPIPVPCNGRSMPSARRAGAVHHTPIETLDVLGWLATGSTWWISWSITKDGHGPPAALAKGTSGIHVYLYGGNVFTKESWVNSKGQIVHESPQSKIPAGADQAFIHVAGTPG